MCADATTAGDPSEPLAAGSRATVLLVVFVALLVAVPVAAAQPTDRATPFDENETDGEDGTAANATTTTENGTTDDATTTHDASTSDAATTSSPTTTSSLTTTQTAATPPENVTYTVVVYPTAERVVVRAVYTTYSSAEAARAENGTLDSSWFDGEERLREAFAARTNDELVHSSNLTSRAVFAEAEYTDIVVEMEFEWHGVFVPEEEREVIGPHIAEAFRPGDRLVVEVFEWKPETVNTDAEPTSHPRNVRYDWTIGEGDEPPRIVFNRSVVLDDDGESATGTDIPFGPAAGGLLSVAALLCFVLFARNRRTP